MKKLLTLVLAVLMLATMSVTAFAAETTIEGEKSTTIDVKAIYTTGEETPDVISVDLVWGEMEFTYHVGTTKTWDPETHTYNIVSDEGTWTPKGNTVTATNHSNIGVNVSFGFESSVNDVTGKFDGITSPVALHAGPEGRPDDAASVVATLILDGKLTDDYATMKSVGTITVTIAKQ